jgi:hypothetical protein
MAVFDPALYSSAAAGSPFPGVTWTARDSNVPRSGVDVQPLFWAPRVGAAYDLFGTGKTLLRGGFGVFNFHDAQGPYSQFIDLPYGVTFTNAVNVPLSQVSTVDPSSQPGLTGAIFVDDNKQPRTQSWSMTIQQRIPFRMMVEAAYVGSKSDRLLNDGINNANSVPFGAMLSNPGGDPNAYRPLSAYGDLPVTRHTHYQNYNALQTLLSRQGTRFSFTSAYTWSKALGIRGGGQGSTTQPPGDLRDSAYGVLGYDRRHVVNIGYSWLLPDVKKNAVLSAIAGGWQFTGVSTWISGAPLQPLAGTGVNFGLTGTLADGTAISNPVITGSPSIAAMPIITCDPTSGTTGEQIFNPNCFGLPSPGKNGSYIMPDLRGPAYMNHDFGLFKNFVFNDTRKFQFRASLTNVFNHPQRFLDDNANLKLNYENGVMTNADFGVLPTNRKYGRRIVQLAFKLYF